MDLANFNRFLAAAVNAGGSDIHFKAGNSPALRVNGELVAYKVPALAPEDTRQIAGFILEQVRYKGDPDELLEYDTSYTLEGLARFRVNIFRNRGNLAAVLRAIPFEIPTFEALGLPPILSQISQTERGLVLVTGATGSGKSTTLAAIAGFINKNERKHIITIEDPIEYQHQDLNSRVTQREIGPDTSSFAAALRSALRQDPDVILVGEMRDMETIDIALKAAETGHLVLSTVHTTDAVRTINRLLGVFPPDVQHGIRGRLAECLKATISQRLLPAASSKGRVAAVEVMISTATVVGYIRDPARTGEIKDYLEKSSGALGTQSFDQHIAKLIQGGQITEQVGLEAATNPSDLQRAMHFE